MDINQSLNSHQKTLSELYAIRAGLSLINECNDTINNFSENLKQYDKKIQEAVTQQQIKRYEKKEKIDFEKKELADNKFMLKHSTELKAKKLNEAKQFKPKKTANIIALLIGIAISIIGFLLLFTIDIYSYESGDEAFAGISLRAATAITGIITFFVSCNGIKKIKKESHKIYEIIDLSEKQIKYAEHDIKCGEANLIKLEKEYKKLESVESVRDKLLKKKNKYEQECQKKYNEALYSGKATLTTLETKYYIDPRDWENLDLLIYYVETGRADTIKEALQLVDRAKQTQAIITAIEYANSEISKTMHLSLDKLSNSITSSLDQLGVQVSSCIKEQTQIIEKKLSDVSETANQANDLLNKTNFKLDESIISQKAQTALLNKISTNSSDLTRAVQDFKESYMRYGGSSVYVTNMPMGV